MSESTNADVNGVRAIIMDVDGVLTNGMVTYGSDHRELKSFHVRDGMAITVALKCEMKVGFITSRASEIVNKRAEELQVDYLFQGVRNKLSKIIEISQLESIPLENMCYIGDDFLDIPVLKRVGFPATVADAPEEVKSLATYVSRNRGGEEAVRDIIRHILNAQGKWNAVVESLVRDWEKGDAE